MIELNFCSNFNDTPIPPPVPPKKIISWTKVKMQDIFDLNISSEVIYLYMEIFKAGMKEAVQAHKRIHGKHVMPWENHAKRFGWFYPL
jgi:hypothetical protein